MTEQVSPPPGERKAQGSDASTTGVGRRRLVIASLTTPVVLKLGMRGANGKTTTKTKSGNTSIHSSVKKKTK